MKLLFIFLLAINAIFFSWQFFSADTAPVVVSERADAEPVATLVLLSDANVGDAVDENRRVKARQNVIEELVVAEAPVVVELTAPDLAASRPVLPLLAPPLRSCFKLGPIASEKNAKSLLRIFSGLSVDAQQRKVNRQVIKGYRVSIPFIAYDKAVEKVAELKKSGFKDIAIVDLKTEGYVVSLGFFKFSSSAKRRIAGLKKKGYESELEPRYKNKFEYWVDIKVDGQGDESLWRDVDDKFPNIDRQKIKCL